MNHDPDYVNRLERRLEALRLWGERVSNEGGLRNLFLSFLPNLSQTMGAERSTLFLYDAHEDQLWSLAAEGATLHQFVLPMGKGLAGSVAKSLEPILVEDAYDDPRFDRSHDQASGFRTKSVLAIPILEPSGALLGVIQVLNRRDGTSFLPDDLDFLKDMSQAIATIITVAKREEEIIVQNTKLDRAVAEIEAQRSELDLLVEIEKASTEAVNLEQFFQSLLISTVARLDSERAFLILSDKVNPQLYSFEQKTKEFEVVEYPAGLSWMRSPPKEQFVASADDELSAEAKAFFEYFREGPPGAILAFPIMRHDEDIGTLVVMNPKLIRGRTVGYQEHDLTVFETVSSQIGNVMERLRLRNEKVETQRLAQIGQMLAGVAHDVRNPMTAISGFAQLMAMSDDSAMRGQMLEKVQVQSRSIISMLNDVMTFAKGDTSLNLSLVTPQQLWTPILDLISPLAEPRRIKLDVTCSQDAISVDDNKVRRIIYNLVKNSLEASSRKQTVSVELSSDVNAGLTIKVKDEAGGLPPEVKASLFKPFVTVGKRSGTGLGLSIVKRFIDDHGGEVKVTSKESEGTVFEVTLPSQNMSHE